GRTVAELAALPLTDLAGLLDGGDEIARVLTADLKSRIAPVVELGLGYLSMDRATPTLSAGELQRLRLATQLRSGLFGVVYVLDEPSAGLHPADTEALLAVLARLRAAGNSVFVVEHHLDVVRRADWVVDVGPGAGEHGGRVLYSGPPAELASVEESATAAFLFDESPGPARDVREPRGWLTVGPVTRHNLREVTAAFPLGAFTAVTGVSGSGKSTLVGELTGDLEDVERLVRVDQRPIGRTPRSNLATYTGLFDVVRKVFAGTEEARARGYGVGRFSFNVAGGRCETCQGEGFVSVELLFLPSTYAPCPDCGGARYNPETLEVTYRGRSIAEVLDLTVEAAADFFADAPGAARSLGTLLDVGLGYLRLGQPATELSGGEAQRIKLASELQRGRRGHTLYLLDEPTTGLHPADVEVLTERLHGLVDAGHTVVVVEHDMTVVAGADWVIDLGPGGGDRGGRIVAAGPPRQVARAEGSATAPYLARVMP
ncbi:ATP-binding cassette domain-containing protein, partial [Streptomyces capoamus]|uniref:ATP-binding cassette domain-containing protein n=1 Tax=Streptomyces capoamus TaxID=68183 RepID=UPI001E3F42EE